MAELLDDNRLKIFRQRIKKQFNDAEPVLIGVHPHAKADGGVYEFEVSSRPAHLKRCYFWNFISTVEGGDVAMDVADASAKTADDVVTHWLAVRKLANKKTY